MSIPVVAKLARSLTFGDNDKCIVFYEHVTVYNNDPVIIPASSLTESGEIRYGSDWPSKVVLTYIVQSKLSKIRIKYIADDQGFGGTGHANVRYQINTDEPVVMAFLKHNEYENNIYTYDINTSLIPGDKITLYLICPPWNAWRATIHDIYFRLYHDL